MTALITGEAVALELQPARVASRGLAFTIDAVIQLTLLVALLLAGNGIASTLGGDEAITAAMLLVATVIALIGYPVVSEVVSRGRSLGKAALGLRVVRSDGGPERFRHALVRALFGFVEIWLTAGSIALIASLISRDGKRLGDQFAGTLVVLERVPARASPMWSPAPWLVPWVTTTDLSRVPDDLAAAARQLLIRANELDPAVRVSMGQQLATSMAAFVSPPAPPGTSAEDYLAAVVAERRRREEWRLAAAARAAQQADASPTAPPPPVAPAAPTTPPPAVAPVPVVAPSPDMGKPPAEAGGFTPPS